MVQGKIKNLSVSFTVKWLTNYIQIWFSLGFSFKMVAVKVFKVKSILNKLTNSRRIKR